MINKQDRITKMKKAILDALEERPTKLEALIPCFFALSIIGIGISTFER